MTRIEKRFRRENRIKGKGLAATSQSNSNFVKKAKTKFGDLSYEALLFMSAMEKKAKN